MKITLPFPPSSNTAYPTARNGRRIKSAKLKEWITSAPKIDIKAPGFVRIEYLLFFPDDRVRDGQNFLKVPLDYIVSEGVLKDDNRRILKGESWLDGGIDRENPRIELTIKSINWTAAI